MWFTYRPISNGTDLCQGDLLKIEGELHEIINRFHRYYAEKDDYKYLMVLTQSCDLVTRNGGCKAKYINLCPVRPVEVVYSRMIEGLRRGSETLDKIQSCHLDQKYIFKDFISKLINNNHNSYFYLADDSVHIPELDSPHVAFLQLGIAIKPEQYENCLLNRFAGLNDVFQAKLGWLLGNNYSRVGTPDWVPSEMGKEEFEDFVENTCNMWSLWVTDHELKKIKSIYKRMDKDQGLTRDDVIEFLAEIKRELANKRKKFSTHISNVIKEEFEKHDVKLDDVYYDSITKRLINDSALSQYLK